jgi:8-oxo-dGTP diphosphatase
MREGTDARSARPTVKRWTVAGGLVLGDEGLLLVRNRRRSGAHDWSPPGGVIEQGEAIVAGLTREVVEETGVEVLDWAGPVYEVEVEAPDLGWHLRVEAHLARAFQGELRVDDPDGIVVEAAWVDPEICGQHLRQGHPWVREPVCAWLDGIGGLDGTAAWSHRTFRYHVAGTDPGSLVVTALQP